ncbi:MAG: hypothetical protein ACKO11_15660 [Cuspidothrix sp.]
MTSHTNEIKQLIGDIDQLLSHSNKGLSKFLSNQGQQEREILQRVREFLSKLDEDQEAERQIPENTSHQSPTTGLSALITQFKEQSNVETESQYFLSQQEATNIPTSRIQEQLKILLEPLQAELSKLLAQRGSLIEEIRQLEQKRLQNYSLNQQLANQEQMIAEFLEVLKGRLGSHLKLHTDSANQGNLEAITSGTTPILESAARVEQLTSFTQNLDQRLLALDGTINVIFETLECNINTYYQSLSQALAKMHDHGMQGEQLMANFLNNLTQHLQQQVIVNEPVVSEVNIEPIPPSLPEESNNLDSENPPLAIPDAVIAENVPSEIESPQTQSPDIVPITLNTELLAEIPQSEEDIPGASTDEIDELYASFFNVDVEIPVPLDDLSFFDATIPTGDGNLAINSESIQDDLLNQTAADTAEITSKPQLEDLQSKSGVEDRQSNKEMEIIDLSAPTQLEPIPEENSIDRITVLTELLIDGEDEELPLLTLSDSLDNSDSDMASVTLSPVTTGDNQETTLDNTPALNTETETDNINGAASNLGDLGLTIATGIETQARDTYIEEKTVAISESPVTNQQSPITIPQPSIPNDDNHEIVTGYNVDTTWYLGIDIGTTGISAALLNRSKLVVYPIYWSAQQQDGSSTFEQSFRLPAEVYLPTNSTANQGKDMRETAATHIYSAQLKPFLHIGVPYQQERQKWEPMLQLNEFFAGPLIWVVRSLSKLLLTLRSSQTSTTPALIANALGMNNANFSTVIKNISGVICSCPSNWTEQYRFNIREAILTSQLVSHPQQILFVEEAIAALLPELDTFHGQPVEITNNNEDLQVLKTSDYPLLGNTLTINIGAIATEMSLVDIPANLDELTHNHFMLHNFAYAGKGMEQDIICQLLLPPKSRQTRQLGDSNSQSANTNPWNWQPSIPGLDQMQFSSLGLETLTLPKVGEPDVQARIVFQQRLESSPLGQALLDAALALKLILQHQEAFTLELADQRWVLQRRDLESQVFVPFVRRLNRELNKLLVARGIPTETINQAILGGGVAAVGTINRWLRQKLPNAKIIQDSYLGENGTPNCSRVALGLAMLPLHPQILDIPQQQYTDYFLFSELLKILPNRTLSFGEVLQLFESRGINTRNCQQRLLAFLEGELPPGLIPASADRLWLTHQSQQNPDYKTIASLTPGSSPLVEKQGNLSYRPNYEQVQFLLRYLDTIKSSTVQSLDAPYTYLLQSQV